MKRQSAKKESTKKPKWGQSRRLAFIDLRLQYDGRINRKDLGNFFDISTPQASADLRLYQDNAPKNLSYDLSDRVYVAQPGFKPIYGHTAAAHFLDELALLEQKVLTRDESFIGYVPATGVVATPARAIRASEVAVLVKAIRDRLALRVRYQSMENLDPLDLVLSPHALGFDGLRWHARAWCHARQIFRDFAIGRLKVLGVEADVPKKNPKLDRGWHTHVPVVLVPHPNLSSSQRHAVLHDYGMDNGKLELNCRKAMLFYTLRHLRLESPDIRERAAEQHVIVENRDQVENWIAEDRAGNNVPMP